MTGRDYQAALEQSLAPWASTPQSLHNRGLGNHSPTWFPELSIAAVITCSSVSSAPAWSWAVPPSLLKASWFQPQCITTSHCKDGYCQTNKQTKNREQQVSARKWAHWALGCYRWEYKRMQPLEEKKIGQLLKQWKIELPCDPVIPPLNIYHKELKTGFLRDICTLMFIAALFIIAKQ